MKRSGSDSGRRLRVGRGVLVGAGAAVLAVAGVTVAAGPRFGPWATVDKIDEIPGNHPDLNTDAVDGCPIQSPNGLQLFLASSRTGGHGGLDIWMATRASKNDPWGAPVNLPAPINSDGNDFCPTPLTGGRLLFVSNRSIPGVTCGMGDIYLARRTPKGTWTSPRHLDCHPHGPNSNLDEQGPSLAQGRLYFSRSSPTVAGDLYVARRHGPRFGAATPITELNHPMANDIQPNVRKDGRELVFSSNRDGGNGGQDIWVATRPNTHTRWSPPVNLGPPINTNHSESRPSLSRDATQLLFGRAGPAGTGEGQTGASDIYLATRPKHH